MGLSTGAGTAPRGAVLAIDGGQPRILDLKQMLERFVAREPLYRVHECVFGVLALESDVRGRDVLPDMHWFPFVTFWQVTADLPGATGVPSGHDPLGPDSPTTQTPIAVPEAPTTKTPTTAMPTAAKCSISASPAPSPGA